MPITGKIAFKWVNSRGDYYLRSPLMDVGFIERGHPNSSWKWRAQYRLKAGHWDTLGTFPLLSSAKKAVEQNLKSRSYVQ